MRTARDEPPERCLLPRHCPIKRVVVRGGARLDSLSYGVRDRTSNAGLERTAQGFVVSSKAMADIAVSRGVHLQRRN
ncbi:MULTISPECIES: hypothetical protein [Sorangium]|uniref:hypothetical protein n=1 Tax=Sorangium TaxID=39643 RepID=UPI0012FFB52C|nr:hypothetical protein [Sorangium cellulosum]